MPGHSSPREIFRFVFQWWLFIFIAVLLPLDFLYRCGSLFSAFSLLQLGQNLSVIIFLFTITALCLAVVSSALALGWGKISPTGAETIRKINTVSGLLFIIIIFLDSLWRWAKIIINIRSFTNANIYSLTNYLFVILLGGVAILVYKYLSMVDDRIKWIARSSYKIIIYPVILCTTIILIIAGFNIFIANSDSRDISITKKGNQPDPYPNIVIVTFDALAARYTSFYGNPLQTTANLDRLARESYVFDNMYASSNWTLPSISSLMTGKYPANHGVNDEISFFSGEARKQALPYLLKGLGYETAIVWSNFMTCPWENNLEGFDHVLPNRVFGKFLYQTGLGPTPWLNNLIYESRFYRVLEALFDKWFNRSGEIPDILKPEFSFAQASELLTKLKKPFFLWVHLYPPHDPYLSRRDFLYTILPEKVFDTKKEYSRSLNYSPAEQPEIDKLFKRYEENIRYADHEFGNFLAFLKRKNIFNDTILIVSSDHGEMFHWGFWSHGGPYLYEPLIHIPLVIHFPNQTSGRRINSDLSNVDIAPTILDLVGSEAPGWMDGHSFRPVLEDGNFDTGMKFSMNLSYTNCPASFMTKSIAVIRGNYELIKYIDLNKYVKYNVKNDKIISKLSPKEAEVFSSLQKDLERVLSKKKP